MTVPIEVLLERIVVRYLVAEDAGKRVEIAIAELGQQVRLSFGEAIQEAIMMVQGVGISLALPRPDLGSANSDEWRAFARTRLQALFDDIAVVYAIANNEDS